MSVALLDVNILLPLWSPHHRNHEIATRWFTANRSGGWATCVITQTGFVRISCQDVFGSKVGIAEPLNILERACKATDHQFWILDGSLNDLQPEIRRRLIGQKQLTDAILLDLAIRRKGRLATFDAGIRSLLPADSPYQNAIEVIPA